MLSVAEIIGIVAAIAVPLAGAVVFERKRNEAKNKVLEEKNKTIVDLTKSFLEVTNEMKIAVKDVKGAVENNTAVIKELPEQFVLHMKANGIVKH